MKHENLIAGETEDEVWQQINSQLTTGVELLEYSAVIVQQGRRVLLDIEIDLGGGFESGFETTSFISHLLSLTDFRFAIHHQHFTDEIGKFFGMQDVEIGYKEFDEKLVIKTNDNTRVKQAFSNPSARTVFQSLDDFSFGIINHHSAHPEKDGPFLELLIDIGITDPTKLREIYHAFFSVLEAIDQ